MDNTRRRNISLYVDPLGDGLRQAVVVAAEAGYTGVAVGVGHPQMAAPDFGATARRDLMKTLQSRHLTLSAIRVGAGPSACTHWSHAERLIHQTYQALRMARDCRADRVLIYLGEPASQTAGHRGDTAGSAAEKAAQTRSDSDIARQVIDELLAAGDRMGVNLTFSSGHAAWLSDLVKPHAGKSVGAALDSARVLAAGHSPTHAAVELAGLIHVWVCADAVRSGSSVQNVPLGNGGGDIRAVAERLDEQYFSGPVIVDIRGLANPVAAARHAAGVLQDMLPSGSSSLQR